ncbi:MAG: hypothetical protein JNM45_15680 [Rhizobiales bacterium]|nr:hypothetical protein [Hyphomicrobiales bacterium]
MNSKLVVGVAALSLLLAASTAARADDDHRLDEAWKAAMEDNEGLLTPEQMSGLNVLAYESAAARLCDGIKLDEKKYAASVTEVAKGGDALTEDEQMQRLAAIMYKLGTANGLFLAEGSAKKDAFCTEAMAQKADKDSKHNWE